MISTTTLNELRDDELRGTRGLIDEILHKRDEDRKAKAVIEVKAILAAAGLTPKDLGGKAKGRSVKGMIYHGGHTYQHPANKSLVWNAKGKKPGWLNALEAEGKSPVEVA